MTPLFDQYPWAVIALASWLGLCFGSFSNVLIYRLPRNLSVVGPRSFCPGCGKMVAWYDNIPVISWLLLRGKCRNCESRISPRYILVELAGAACALIGIWSGGFSLSGMATAVFLVLLFNVAVIDWGHMIIPHTLSISGMVLGLVFGHFAYGDLGGSLLGLLAGGGIILVVSYGYKMVRGVAGMGGGDVMLMGMVGAFLGVWGSLAVLFGGALLGSIFALTAGRGKVTGAAKLPFGTFLALAAGIVILFGQDLYSLYMANL